MEPHLHVCMDILVQHDPNKPGGVIMWMDGWMDEGVAVWIEDGRVAVWMDG